MAAPNILVTGFGPFPGAVRNPSTRLALFLSRSRRITRSATVKAAIIPTAYEGLSSALARLLDAEQPDAVLMLGLAGSTPYLRIETRAANQVSSLYPDATRRKTDRMLIAGAPGILPVRAPVRSLLQAARSTGVEARLSNDAGSYICNAALFHALHRTRAKPALPIAFVHIPWPRGRGKQKPGMVGRLPTWPMLERAAEQVLLRLIAALQATR